MSSSRKSRIFKSTAKVMGLAAAGVIGSLSLNGASADPNGRLIELLQDDQQPYQKIISEHTLGNDPQAGRHQGSETYIETAEPAALTAMDPEVAVTSAPGMAVPGAEPPIRSQVPKTMYIDAAPTTNAAVQQPPLAAPLSVTAPWVAVSRPAGVPMQPRMQPSGVLMQPHGLTMANLLKPQAAFSNPQASPPNVFRPTPMGNGGVPNQMMMPQLVVCRQAFGQMVELPVERLTSGGGKAQAKKHRHRAHRHSQSSTSSSVTSYAYSGTTASRSHNRSRYSGSGRRSYRR